MPTNPATNPRRKRGISPDRKWETHPPTSMAFRFGMGRDAAIARSRSRAARERGATHETRVDLPVRRAFSGMTSVFGPSAASKPERANRKTR